MRFHTWLLPIVIGATGWLGSGLPLVAQTNLPIVLADVGGFEDDETYPVGNLPAVAATRTTARGLPVTVPLTTTNNPAPLERQGPVFCFVGRWRPHPVNPVPSLFWQPGRNAGLATAL